MGVRIGLRRFYTPTELAALDHALPRLRSLQAPTSQRSWLSALTSLCRPPVRNDSIDERASVDESVDVPPSIHPIHDTKEDDQSPSTVISSDDIQPMTSEHDIQDECIDSKDEQHCHAYDNIVFHEDAVHI